MDEKHTPAPWSLSSRDVGSGQQLVVRGPATECVAVVPAPLVDRHGLTDPKERAANARLIAAAPELLAVLKRLLAHRHDEDPIWSLEQLEADCRAVIAKTEEPS
ncbi:MAG: hypothetical protein KA105_02590 [Caulobacter sp.]|nr:hypothetical protein [Caulobacter sp.]